MHDIVYFYSLTDKKRVQFFNEVLSSLHVSATTYAALQTQCQRVSSIIASVNPVLPQFADTSALLQLKQDEHSKTLLPSDVPQKLIPLKCSGDGNCLLIQVCIHTTPLYFVLVGEYIVSIF